MRKSKFKYLRLISALTAFSFIFHDLTSFAAIDLSLPSKLDPKSLSLPHDIGIVKESRFSPGSDVIINIKDVHDNFGAQESISQILENLVVNYNVSTIGMEGAEGFVDTSLLAALPDEDMRLKTARFMMQEGKLSAGQFFSAMSGGRIAVYGMDDEKLYEENLEAFKNNLKNKAKNYQAVGRLRRSLSALENALYSPEMLDLNKNGVLNHNGNVRFGDRWQEISSLADKLGVDYRGYAPIQNLIKVMALEKTIDFNAANTERETLLDILSKRVDRSVLEKLILESVNYKMGKISQGSFSSYILDTARKAGVDVEAYKNLLRYADYMLIYEALDIDALKDSIQSLESGIREKIFRNDDERQLYALTRQCDILNDLFEVKLSSASLDYFKKKSGEFKPEVFKKFIQEQSARHRIGVDSALDVDAVFAGISEAMKFYESAEKRNQVILANTVRRMKAEGRNVACLVTGGFHTRGITELMKQNQMSYVVILPRFSKKTTRPYLTLITNNQSSYKEFADSEYALIAKHEITAHFFAQAVFKISPSNSSESAYQKNVRAQKEVERMRVLYLNSFRALKRSLAERGLLKEGSGLPPTIVDAPAERDSTANLRAEQSAPVHTQTIMGHALPLADVVIEGMKVVYAEERVYVLFTTVSGKKYLYVLNRGQDQTTEFSDRSQGPEAVSQYANAESLVEGPVAREERLPVSVTQKLEDLARTLAAQGRGKDGKVSVQALQNAARQKGISARITDVQEVLTNLERDPALSRLDAQREEILETDRKSEALRERLKGFLTGASLSKKEMDTIRQFFSASNGWGSLEEQNAATIEAFAWLLRGVVNSKEIDPAAREELLKELLLWERDRQDILFEKITMFYRSKTQFAPESVFTVEEIRSKLLDPVNEANEERKKVEAAQPAKKLKVAQTGAVTPAVLPFTASTAPATVEVSESAKEEPAGESVQEASEETPEEKSLEVSRSRFMDAADVFSQGNVSLAQDNISVWIDSSIVEAGNVDKLSEAAAIYDRLAKLDSTGFGSLSETLGDSWTREEFEQAVLLAEATQNLKPLLEEKGIIEADAQPFYNNRWPFVTQKSREYQLQKDRALLKLDRIQKSKQFPQLNYFLPAFYKAAEDSLVSEKSTGVAVVAEFWRVFNSLKDADKDQFSLMIQEFHDSHLSGFGVEDVRRDVLAIISAAQTKTSRDRQVEEARSIRKEAQANEAHQKVLTQLNELMKGRQRLRDQIITVYSKDGAVNRKELARFVGRLERVQPEFRSYMLGEISALSQFDKNDLNELLLLSVGWSQAVKVANNASAVAAKHWGVFEYDVFYADRMVPVGGVRETVVRNAAERVADRAQQRVNFLLGVKMKAAQHHLSMGPVLEALQASGDTDFIGDVGNYLAILKNDFVRQERFVRDALNALKLAKEGRYDLKTALKALIAQEVVRRNMEKRLSQSQEGVADFPASIRGLILGDNSLVEAFNRLDDASLSEAKKNVQYFAKDVKGLQLLAERLYEIQVTRSEILNAQAHAAWLASELRHNLTNYMNAQAQRDVVAAKERLMSLEVRLENLINQKKVEAGKDAALLKEFSELMDDRLSSEDLGSMGEVRAKLFALYVDLVDSKQTELKKELIQGLRKILKEQGQYTSQSLSNRVIYFVAEKTGELAVAKQAETNFNDALKRLAGRNKDFIGEAIDQVTEKAGKDFLLKVDKLEVNPLAHPERTGLLNRLATLDAYLLAALIKDLSANFSWGELELFEVRYQRLQENTALMKSVRFIRRTENRMKANERGIEKGGPKGGLDRDALTKQIQEAKSQRDLVMAKFREEEVDIFKTRREAAGKAGLDDEFDDIAHIESSGNAAERTAAWDRMTGAWNQLETTQQAQFKPEIQAMAVKLANVSATFSDIQALEQRMALAGENTQLLKKVREGVRSGLSSRQKNIVEKRLSQFEKDQPLEEFVKALRSVEALQGDYRDFFFKWAAADLPLTFAQWAVLATQVELIQEGPRRIVRKEIELAQERAVIDLYVESPTLERELRDLQIQVIQAPGLIDTLLAQRRETAKAEKFRALTEQIEKAVDAAVLRNEISILGMYRSPDSASLDEGVRVGLEGVLKNVEMHAPGQLARRAATPSFNMQRTQQEVVVGGPIELNGTLATVDLASIAGQIMNQNITTDNQMALTLAGSIQSTANDIVIQNSTLGDEELSVTMQFVSNSQELAYIENNVIHIDISLIERLAQAEEGVRADYLRDLLDLMTRHERSHQRLQGLGLEFLAEEREVLKQDAVYFYNKSQNYRTNVMKALEVIAGAGYDVTPYVNFLKAIDRAAQAAEALRKKEESAARRAHAPPSTSTSRLDSVQDERLKPLLIQFFKYLDEQNNELAQTFFEEKLLIELEESINKNELTGHIDDDNKIKDAYIRFQGKDVSEDYLKQLEDYANGHPTFEQDLINALNASPKHLLAVNGFSTQYFARKAVLQFLRRRHAKTIDQLSEADKASALNDAREQLKVKKTASALFININGRHFLTRVVADVIIKIDEPILIKKMKAIAEEGKRWSLETGKGNLKAAKEVDITERAGHMVQFEGDWFHSEAFDKVSLDIQKIIEHETRIGVLKKEIDASKEQITKLEQTNNAKHSARIHAQANKLRRLVEERDKNEITRAAYILSLEELLDKFSLGDKSTKARAKATLRGIQTAYAQSVKDVDVQTYNEKLQGAIKAIGMGHKAQMDNILTQIQKMFQALALDRTADDFEKQKTDLFSEEFDVVDDERKERVRDKRGSEDDADESPAAAQKRRETFVESRFSYLTDKEGKQELFIGWLTELGVDTSEKRIQRVFQAVREGRVKRAWISRWLSEMASMSTELDRLKTLQLVDVSSRSKESKDRQKLRTDLARNLRRGVGYTISLEGMLDNVEVAKLAEQEKKDKAPKNIFDETETKGEDEFFLTKAKAAWENVKGVSSSLLETFEDLRSQNLEIQSFLEEKFLKTRVLVAMYGIHDVFEANGDIFQGAKLLKWAGIAGLIKIDDGIFKDEIKKKDITQALIDYANDEKIATTLSEIEGMIRIIKDLSFGSETFLDLWRREGDEFVKKVGVERQAIEEKAKSMGLDTDKIGDSEAAIQVLTAVFKERFETSIDKETGKIAEDKVDELTIFVLEAVKLATGWNNGLKPDQLTMLGLFMGYDSAGLLAGGGKTIVYALYHLLARMTAGKNYHGMIIAENADGVNGFTSRPFNEGGANSLQTFFSIFGMRLENGSKMFETHDTVGLSAALKDANTLVVIDKTARAHVNNNSEEDPELRRALNHISVTTVDEIHLFSTDRDAALLSKGTREADLADVKNVLRIIHEIYNVNTGKIKDGILDYQSQNDPKSIGQRIFKTEADYRAAVEEFRDTEAGDRTKMIFQWDEQVYVTKALETHLQTKLSLGSNKIVSSTIKGLLKLKDKSKPGGWTVATVYEGGERKEVIAPIGSDGSVKPSSVISDIHYQAVLALSVCDWDAEKARNYTRESDSSTQVAITDALQTDAGTRVMGASGTVQELEELIRATSASKVVNINASKNQLSTYEALQSMDDVYREIEKTVRGLRGDNLRRGALIAEYDPEKIQEIRDRLTALGIRVRVMGSESDDIGDIVEKASQLWQGTETFEFDKNFIAENEKQILLKGGQALKDLLTKVKNRVDDPALTYTDDEIKLLRLNNYFGWGTATIFNQRGMTGRDYKGRNGIGLDLFHLGVDDEKSTEILFNQTTARNRRNTSDGKRFYLWDKPAEDTVKARLNDLFSPENKELRKEVLEKLQKNANEVKARLSGRSEEEKAFLFMIGKLDTEGVDGLGEFEAYQGELIEEVFSEYLLSNDVFGPIIRSALSKSEKDRGGIENLWITISNTLSGSRSTYALSDAQRNFIVRKYNELNPSNKVSSLDVLRKDQKLRSKLEKKAKSRYQNGMIVLNQKYLTIREINESARFMVQDTSYTRFVVEPLKEALRIVRRNKKPEDKPTPVEEALQTNLESALRRESDHVQLQLGSTEREKGAAYTQGVILSAIQQAEATFRSLRDNEHAETLEKMLGMNQKLEDLKQARDNILSKAKVWDQPLNDREPMTSFAQAKREAAGDYYKLVEYTYRVSQSLAEKKMISKMGRQSHLIEIHRLSNSNGDDQTLQADVYGEQEPQEGDDAESKAFAEARKKARPTQDQLKIKMGTVITTNGFECKLEANRHIKEIWKSGSVGLAILQGDELHIKVRDESQKMTVAITRDASMIRAAKQIMESRESGNGAIFRVEIQNGAGENDGGLNISFTHLPSKMKSDMGFADIVIMGDTNAQVLYKIISEGAGTPMPDGEPEPEPVNIEPGTIRAMAAQLGLSDDELNARISRGLKAYHSLQNAKMLIADIAHDPKKHTAFLQNHAGDIAQLERAAQGTPEKSIERFVYNGWEALKSGRRTQIAEEETRILALSYLNWITGKDKRASAEINTIANYEKFSKEYKPVMDEVLKDVRSIDDPQFYGSIEKYFMPIYPVVRELLAKELAKDPKVIEEAKKDEKGIKKRIEENYTQQMNGLRSAVDQGSIDPSQIQRAIAQIADQKKKHLESINEIAASDLLRNQAVDSEVLRGALQKINLKHEIIKHMRASKDKNEKFMGDLLQRLLSPGTTVNLVEIFDNQFAGNDTKKIEVWQEFQSRALTLGVSPDSLARVSLHLSRSIRGAGASDVNLQEDLLRQANQVAKLGRDTNLQAEVRQAFIEHLDARGERAISAKREIELRHILDHFEKMQGGSGILVSNKVINFRNQLQLIISLTDPSTREFHDNVLVASGRVRPIGWAAINNDTTLTDLEKITGYKADEFREAISLHYGRIPAVVRHVSVAENDKLSDILIKINQKIDEAGAAKGTSEPSVDLEELIDFVTDIAKLKKALVVAEKLKDGLTRAIIDQGDAMAIELQKIQSLLEKFDIFEDGSKRLSDATRHMASNGFLLREGFRQFGFDSEVTTSRPKRAEVFFTHILSEWADREQYHDNSNHDDTMMLVAARNADPELGSLAAQILKNRYSPDAKARAQDFGNIAANIKAFARRDNKLRSRAIDVEAGIDISEGKIFIHTLAIANTKEKDLIDPFTGTNLRRSAKTRVLSRIDTAAEDRGNNVSQSEGGVVSHFRGKTAKWAEDESRGVLTGEKERWIQRMKEDLERMKKNDPQDSPRFIKLTKSGGIDYVNLKDTDEFKNVARGLSTLAHKAEVTGYRDANPKDRERLLKNFEDVLDYEEVETEMKRALFNIDLAEPGDEFRDSELSVWEFQEYVDGWMNDLDVHEVDGHEVQNQTGRSAYWHKRFKGEEGIKQREIDPHLISIWRGKNPHSVLVQPITYATRGSSGIGYSLAGIEILRYIFINLDAGHQARIQDAVEAAVQRVKKEPSANDVPFKRDSSLFDPKEAKDFMLTNPKGMLAMGIALSKVSKKDLQAAAEKGYQEFLGEKDKKTGVLINQAPQQDELKTFAHNFMEGKQGIDDKVFDKSLLNNPAFKTKLQETIPKVRQIIDQEIQYAREHGYGAAVAYLEAQKIKIKYEKYAYRVVKEGYKFVGAQVRGELHTLTEMLKRSPDQSRLMNYIAAQHLLPAEYLKFEEEANANKSEAIKRIRPYLERAGIPESMVNTILSDATRAFLSKSAYREVPFYVEGKSVDKGSTAAYSFDSFELVVVAADDEPSDNSIAEYRHVLNHEIQHFNIDIANEKIREAVVELIALLNNYHQGEDSPQYQDVLRRLGAQEGEYRMFMDFAKQHFKDLSYEALVYSQMTGDLSVLGLYSLEASIATIGFEIDAVRGEANIRSSFNFNAEVLSPNRWNRLKPISIDDLRKVPDESGEELANVIFTVESNGKGSITLKHVHGRATTVKQKGRKKDEETEPQPIKEAQQPIKQGLVPPLPPEDEEPEGEAKLPAWTKEKVVVRFGNKVNFLIPANDIALDEAHQIGQVHARPLTPGKQAEMDGLVGPRASGESWYLLFNTDLASGVSEKPIAVAKIKKEAAGQISPRLEIQPVVDDRGNSWSLEEIKTALTHPLRRGKFQKYLSDPLGQAEIVLDQTAVRLFQELQERIKERSDNAAQINQWYKQRAHEISAELIQRDYPNLQMEIVFPAESAVLNNQLNPVAVNISGPRGVTHGLILGTQPIGRDDSGANVDGPFKFDGPIGAIVNKKDAVSGKVQRWITISDNTLQVILGEPTREDRAMTFLSQEAMRVQETVIRQRGTLIEGDRALKNFAAENGISILYEGGLQNHKVKRVLLPDKKYPDTPEGKRQQKADELRAMHEAESEDQQDVSRTSQVKEGESFSIEPLLVSGKDISVQDKITYWTGSPENPVYLSEGEVDLSNPQNLINKNTGEKVYRWESFESNARNAHTAEKTYRMVKDDNGKLQVLDNVSLDLKDLEVKPILSSPALVSQAPVAARLAGGALPQPLPLPKTGPPITFFAAIVLGGDDDEDTVLAYLNANIQGARLTAARTLPEAKALADTFEGSQHRLAVNIQQRPGQTHEDWRAEILQALKRGMTAIREQSKLSLVAINPDFELKSPEEIRVLLSQMTDDELERTVMATLAALSKRPLAGVDWETFFDEVSSGRADTVQMKATPQSDSYGMVQAEYANRLSGLVTQLIKNPSYVPPIYLAPAANAFVPGSKKIDPAFFQLVTNPNLRLKENIYFYSYDTAEAAALQAQLDALGFSGVTVLDISGTQKEDLVEVVKSRIQNPDELPIALLIHRGEGTKYTNIIRNTPDRFLFIPAAGRLAPLQGLGLAFLAIRKENKSVLFVRTGPSDVLSDEILEQYPWMVQILLPLHLFEDLRQAIANLRQTAAAA